MAVHGQDPLGALCQLSQQLVQVPKNWGVFGVATLAEATQSPGHSRLKTFGPLKKSYEGGEATHFLDVDLRPLLLDQAIS